MFLYLHTAHVENIVSLVLKTLLFLIFIPWMEEKFPVCEITPVPCTEHTLSVFQTLILTSLRSQNQHLIDISHSKLASLTVIDRLRTPQDGYVPVR